MIEGIACSRGKSLRRVAGALEAENGLRVRRRNRRTPPRASPSSVEKCEDIYRQEIKGATMLGRTVLTCAYGAPLAMRKKVPR